MMKHIFITLAILLLYEFSFSQNRDKVWIFSDSVGIDFNGGSPSIINSVVFDNGEMDASISDESGNLLLYINSMSTTGFRMSVYNKYDNQIMNGDSIMGNSSITNGGVFIPYFNSDSIIYLFHQGFGSFFCNFNYSIINLNSNSDSGNVISKNNFLYADSLVEGMAIVKHANGRDWWILIHELNTNTFIKFLFDPYGIHGPYEQSIGSILYGIVGEGVFSPSGNKLSWGEAGVIDLFNFNRCTGELTNWNPLADSGIGVTGAYSVAFSQNENVLYVSQAKYIQSFDLTQSNIHDTRDTVFHLTGSNSNFGQMELAPDGKIYLASQYLGANTFNVSNKNLSVINNPNDYSNPNFSLFSFNLSGHKCYFGLPAMPNYNLDKIDDSPCDTVNAISEINVVKNVLSIFPNPTAEEINIQSSSRINFISITNVLGEKIFYNQCCNFNETKISLKHIPDGIYFIQVHLINGETQIKKFVKQ